MNGLERAAALEALGPLADDPRVLERYDDGRWRFPELIADPTFSSSERTVLRVAFALWNGYYGEAQIGELFTVDADTFDRLVSAIRIRYGR